MPLDVAAEALAWFGAAEESAVGITSRGKAIEGGGIGLKCAGRAVVG